jgi:hypothetical protein
MTKTAAELLRETMDALNSISTNVAPGTPVVAPIATPEPLDRSYMFTTTIMNPVPGDEAEIEVGVDYTMEGKYYPATFDDPAEYPDIVDIKVFNIENGQDISAMLPESVFDDLDDECWAHYSGSPRPVTDIEPDDYMIDESVIPDHKFTTVVSIYDSALDDDVDHEVGVDYSISGKYYPATLEDPEEHPEFELIGVYDLATGADISSQLSDSMLAMIERECMADAKNEDDEAKVDRYLSRRDDTYYD